MPHKAIYPGSFDPPTLGHLDVLARGRRMFDEIVVAVGRNPEKSAFLPVEQRVSMLETLVAELLDGEPGAAPVTIASYDGLTVDFAREIGASAILRGIRNVTDLAAECQLAITNRQVAEIETVFMITGERYAFTSSSLIRQVAALGGSLDRLTAIVPQIVIDRMKEKMGSPDNPLAHMARDEHID